MLNKWLGWYVRKVVSEKHIVENVQMRRFGNVMPRFDLDYFYLF